MYTHVYTDTYIDTYIRTDIHTCICVLHGLPGLSTSVNAFWNTSWMVSVLYILLCYDPKPHPHPCNRRSGCAFRAHVEDALHILKFISILTCLLSAALNRHCESMTTEINKSSMNLEPSRFFSFGCLVWFHPHGHMEICRILSLKLVA